MPLAPPLVVTPKSGTEPFHTAGVPLSMDLLAFWRWACSDLCGNALRGLVAEFLVARAVGAPAPARTEWTAYDVLAPDGTKIEVKCSAYVQSWAQQSHSKITFDIAQKRAWNPDTNAYDAEPTRSSDVYVFAVHAHRDRATVDPLDLAQWEFYVLATRTLTEKLGKQKTLALSSLQRLKPRRVAWQALGDAVREQLH